VAFFVGDITYIHTKEGWLYLAVVIDLYSRQVVRLVNGRTYTHRAQVRAKLVNDALLMAIWQRKPANVLLWQSICLGESQEITKAARHPAEYEPQRQLLDYQKLRLISQ